jgi:small subunit ribosomal protein S1
VLNIGDTVAVKVLDIDRSRQRISLGLKQTQEDPWQRMVDTYNLGDELAGKVTKVVPFGAFVEVLDGVEGLVHISELAPRHVENPREIVHPGDEIRVKILEIDSERRRLSLSAKRVEDQVLPLHREQEPDAEAPPESEAEAAPQGSADAEAESAAEVEAASAPTEAEAPIQTEPPSAPAEAEAPIQTEPPSAPAEAEAPTETETETETEAPSAPAETTAATEQAESATQTPASDEPQAAGGAEAQAEAASAEPAAAEETGAENGVGAAMLQPAGEQAKD